MNSDKPQPLSGAAPRPSYYAQGTATKYIEGIDPEVTCGHCGKTFLCDAMDASCRLCGKVFRDAPPENSAAAPVAVPAPPLSDEQIEYMVRRFLQWRLPENFTPDAGISFKPTFNDHLPVPMKHDPVGTNLFDYTQTKEMVRHMLEGMPAPAPLPPSQEPRCLPGAYRSDGPCKDCGMPCLPWFAPNEIWNRVVAERSGLLCPVCFLERAFKAGIDGHWILQPEFHDEEKTRTDQSATSPQSESQNAESVFSQEPLASPPEREKDTSETLSAGETRTEAWNHETAWEEWLLKGGGKIPTNITAMEVAEVAIAFAEYANAAAASRIAQLEQERKEAKDYLREIAKGLCMDASSVDNASCHVIAHYAENLSRNYTTTFQELSDARTKLKTAEAALTQAQQEQPHGHEIDAEHDEWCSGCLHIKVTRLMEAIEPIQKLHAKYLKERAEHIKMEAEYNRQIDNAGDMGSTSGIYYYSGHKDRMAKLRSEIFEQIPVAARVYEQVKEKI